jgi:hypothetical protein
MLLLNNVEINKVEITLSLDREQPKNQIRSKFLMIYLNVNTTHHYQG